MGAEAAEVQPYGIRQPVSWISIFPPTAGSGPLPGWQLAASGDFDRNGVRDLIWQNDATCKVTLWQMGGSTGSDMRGWAKHPCWYGRMRAPAK
jgi:hypothetical protein